MANLIIICGPQAVGKMTVAESLRDKLKYNLMVNHDSIEISDRIFGFATPAQKELNSVFRENVFALAVKHNIDMLFTYVCRFEMPEEHEYLTNLENLFTANGGNFYFVELRADIETRIERNETPHRLNRKFSKRDIEWSKSDLLQSAEKYKLNTSNDEVWFDNHLKIDNTKRSADEVANMVINEFQLVANEKDEKEYRFGV